MEEDWKKGIAGESEKKLEIKNINGTVTITIVPLSFVDFKKVKVGFFGPNEKVLLAKIDLHKIRRVYCSKPLNIPISLFVKTFF